MLSIYDNTSFTFCLDVVMKILMLFMLKRYLMKTIMAYLMSRRGYWNLLQLESCGEHLKVRICRFTKDLFVFMNAFIAYYARVWIIF